jgi:Ni/Fe-hydrogenase 1 B-type cytochrome subunit
MNLADQQDIRRVKVWSGAFRLAHGVIGLSVLCLLLTGWALNTNLAQEPERVLSAHRTAGYVLAGALLLRLYLLFFGAGAEHWRDILPRGPQWQAGRAVMRFYLTAGRSPLPAYYAHNPLWGPVYLGLFLLLTGQVFTGVVLANPGVEFVLRPVLPWTQAPSLLEFHLIGNAIVLAFTLLHLASVLLQDWKSSGCDISAMVHGIRLFVIDRGKLEPPGGSYGVPISSIKRAANRREP